MANDPVKYGLPLATSSAMLAWSYLEHGKGYQDAMADVQVGGRCLVPGQLSGGLPWCLRGSARQLQQTTITGNLGAASLIPSESMSSAPGVPH